MSWPTPLDDYLARKTEIDAAIARVLASGRYILGPEVVDFEAEFAAYTGAEAACGVASGTDALSLALLAVGVRPGQSVITVSHTAVATVAAIEAVGAVPRFVDVESARMTMDPDRLAEALGSVEDLAAVVVVHLYGQPADMPSIMATARSAGVPVVEDCSQAHGATIDGQHVGTFGDVGAFSCYPTKNLGALGDAGVAIGSAAVCDELKLLRQYGWRERYVSEVSGRNSRLDPLQAAVLRLRLRDLDESLARRREIAATYTSELAGDLTLPQPSGSEAHAFHQYTVRTPARAELVRVLEEKSVPYAILYPLPVHLQPAYAGASHLPPDGLPVSELACRELVCLPVHPRLQADQGRLVVEAVLAGARAGRAS